MQLTVTARNIELSAPARRHIERKMGRLGRYLTGPTQASLEITEQKTKSPLDRFVAQATITGNGAVWRGLERSGNLLSAVDRLSEVIQRQIEHHKGKFHKKVRSSSPARGNPGQGEVPQGSGSVVKVKRFAIKPMSVEEAIEQMEAMGHNFFLFYNGDTQGLNLVYRRRDGDYGLIEPELG